MVAMACGAATWANQVGYITLDHGCHDLSWITTPSDLGVVIDDKSWLPWRNY